MKLLLSFIALSFLFAPVTAHAQTQQTTSNPHFNCLGSCPTIPPPKQPLKPIQRGIAPAGAFFFINAIACHRPGKLKGIASVAGGDPAAQCTQKQPIAAMFVHGVADQPVPIDTGRSSRDYWLGVNGYTSGTPTTTTPSQCVAYPGTSKPTLWCEHVGGHDWPTWAGNGIRNFFLDL